MKKFTIDQFRNGTANKTTDSSGGIVIRPKKFIVGGTKNPSSIEFDAESLNSGTQDAALFKAAVANNKMTGIKTSNTATQSPMNIDENSVLSREQQLQNKMALDVLGNLGVSFIETPSSLLLEINKDEEAGMIPSSKYLGENTLFTTESLYDSSLFDRNVSVTSEMEMDVDISGIATTVVNAVFQSATGAREVGLNILGKKSK